MAATETTFTTTTTRSHLQLQTHPNKPRARRPSRETPIPSSPATTAVHDGSTNITSSNKISNTNTQNPKLYSPNNPVLQTNSTRFSSAHHSQIMDFTANSNGHHSNFTKFNSALTAGLLNPMSPPPDPTRINQPRSSPTLFEMMSSDPDSQPPSRNQNQVIVQDKQALTMQRITQILREKSPGNQFNEESSSDVKVSLSSKDGVNVEMNLHRQILVGHSRFFAVKLSDREVNEKKQSSGTSEVEIADCEDVEVYVETLRLMYCKDLRRWLVREDVVKVLGILKVSAAIGFDAGVMSCLEYLEAAPWAEDEEEKVTSLLSELHLERVGAGEVLKRVTIEPANGIKGPCEDDQVLLNLLNVVLEGKDEKAKREMKGVITRLLHENSSHSDIGKESLYSACDGCLKLLRGHFLGAALGDMDDAGQIAKRADNLHWILDILVDRHIAEDFLKTWASQSDLAEAHSRVPAVHRYEISRVTARLFVGIGKGQVLASKEVRWLLLRTWLVPFYNDFCWMRRASKGLDRHLIEEGLSNTILTLPLAWQQEILLAWFDRFLNSGEDCPNIQRGFEIWWRRAFWRRSGEQERPLLLKVTSATTDNL